MVADWKGRSRGTLGEVRLKGCLILYRTAAVSLLPDRPLIGLVVHELAHCYGYAEGLHGHRPGEDSWVAEDCVYDLLDDWGLVDYQDEQEEWLAGDGAGVRKLLDV